MALAFGPTLLIPLMLFGGLFLNNGTIPVKNHFRYSFALKEAHLFQVYLNWIKYVSWFMYSNEALLINQWKGVEFQVKEIEQLTIHLSQFIAQICTPEPVNICTNKTGEEIVNNDLKFNMVKKS